MRKPIVVGRDPRRADHAPVDFGATLAKLTGAPLIIACVEAGSPVVPLYAGSTLPYAIVHDDLVGDCSAVVEEIDAAMRAAGVAFDCRTLRSTSAARALHSLAEEEHAALLVVGTSRHRGVDRLLAGSTPESLLHAAPCAVSVVPPDFTMPAPIQTVGAAYVAGEEGREALRSAHALARAAGATLRVITVAKGRDRDVTGEERRQVENELRQAATALEGDVRVEADVLSGDPAEALVRASERLDVLVLGSRGYGPVRAVLLGSVSRRVTAEALCPVIVLPRGVEVSLQDLVEPAPATVMA